MQCKSVINFVPQIGNFAFLRIISAVLAGVGPSSGEVLGGLTRIHIPDHTKCPVFRYINQA